MLRREQVILMFFFIFISVIQHGAKVECPERIQYRDTPLILTSQNGRPEAGNARDKFGHTQGFPFRVTCWESLDYRIGVQVSA
jgi:hypothetical protein